MFKEFAKDSEAALERDESPIIGIDLGTTNSLAAHVQGGEPRILESREGKRLTPSVVSFVDDKPVVGYAAKFNKVRDAAHTVFSVKRLLGRGFEDLSKVSGDLPYKIVPAAQDQGAARIEMGGKLYTAVEISAMILRELKLGAEKALGTSVSRAVITVPAYFNDAQRQATRTAGRIAGLDVLRIINEPTAASLAYGLDKKKQGLIAVYDLGGGTFDVSILKLHDGIFEVLATHGDTSLGGDDLDLSIARIVAIEIEKTWGVNPFSPSNVQLHAALLESAESVKIALSERSESVFELDFDGKKFSRKFTLAEFEAAARPVLERTREPCLRALRDAGLSVSDLSDVVLVGGPTRLKLVQNIAREIFGREPNTSVHPDEVVAAGAAIQADILAGRNRDLLLLDVVPLSLGIETYGGLMSVLITRNTRIPTVARESFTTFVDRQTGIDIHVLQGERDRVEDNRSLARFKLKGIDPQPAGFPRVEVTFLIDADGILQVSAKDIKTGTEQSIEVRPTHGLSEQEIEKMVLSSADHAQTDIAFRKLVDVKNQAETVLRAAERKLSDARRLLPPSEAAEVEQSVTGLRTALHQSDPDEIQSASARVDRSTRHLADLLIKEAIVNRRTE